MPENANKANQPWVPINSGELTQRGKSFQEIEADLLAGESDDPSIEFLNSTNSCKGES